MYCPRCGTPNEADDRFCSACGAALGRGDSTQSRTNVRERLGDLVGKTRRARMISAATALAIVVAIVGFIALEPSDDGIPRDDYTLAAERICLDAKQQIVATGQRFRAQSDAADASEFARALLPTVTDWRLRFANLQAPVDREREAAQLAAALREVEARIAKLARDASASHPERTTASAARADEASTAVEEAVSSLGLEECASVKLGFVPDKS